MDQSGSRNWPMQVERNSLRRRYIKYKENWEVKIFQKLNYCEIEDVYFISSRFSRNSEAFASELLEYFEEVFQRYW